ncbi:TetR/AcrR family transcriptional regulator [Paenibacillus sp. 481]|uniref:TetR/AcrR family transcriptional regulator n=1 Tax=Paenibacillus sp. 481 TaxID=2835869 RepID=UPI001E40CD4D|nr:TetR/AcrR family transcriptional regulator [Paenibacillus sp. 481]UHA73739.1 TetR/AcrR family transcriptional regulator [Paenibacillus sp. 481]
MSSNLDDTDTNTNMNTELDGYQRRTERKKATIRTVAFSLFTEHGVEKVSMAQIAKKANVSPVTVYNYFGSKDELFIQSFIHYAEQEMVQFVQLVDEDSPFSTKIETLIFQRNEAAKMFSMSFLEVVLTQYEPLQQYYMELYYQRVVPLLHKLIEQGRQEGALNNNLSTESIMLYISMFKEAATKPEFYSRTNPTLLQDLTTLLFYGMVGKP